MCFKLRWTSLVPVLELEPKRTILHSWDILLSSSRTRAKEKYSSL